MAKKEKESSEEEERSEWAKPWFVVSAIVVALLVMIGAMVLIVAQLNKPVQQAQTPDAPPTSEVQVQGCPAKGSTDQTVPTTAPSARWVLYKKIAIPTSTDAGPFANDGNGIRSCYAHTPTGALFAASNLMALGTQQDIVTVLERFSVPSAVRDAELKRAKSSAKGSYQTVQVAGYQIQVQDQDHAKVTLAFRFDSHTASATYNMRWQDGDWKMVVPSGENALSVTVLNDLSGFITFNGV